ncbi:MAG: PepSY domain-containing protein [Pseudomonadota bacterium]
MTTRRFLLAAMGGAALTVMLGAGAATTAVAAGVTAQEQTRTDQGTARREMRAGNQLSLREIEKRVLPTMRGAEYLGPSYDSTARAYRLKFIRDGRVTYVDVDARTGRVISRTR